MVKLSISRRSSANTTENCFNNTSLDTLFVIFLKISFLMIFNDYLCHFLRFHLCTLNIKCTYIWFTVCSFVIWKIILSYYPLSYIHCIGTLSENNNTIAKISITILGSLKLVSKNAVLFFSYTYICVGVCLLPVIASKKNYVL